MKLIKHVNTYTLADISMVDLARMQFGLLSIDQHELQLFGTLPVEGDITCEWCGTIGDDEQGPVVATPTGQMHLGCAWSEQHGGMATVLKGDS